MDHNKYDRQLRLWSNFGQNALSSSHVVVAGISLATLEAAKGLIMTGIGTLTLVIGSHSEITTMSLFSPKINELCDQLRELNSDVSVTSVSHLEEAANDVTLVIRSASCRYSLTDLTTTFSAPVLTLGSHMLSGFVRVTASALFVLQSHPEVGLADLRISKTSLDQWPELRAYCDSFDLDKLSDTDHSHVPYYVLLVKAYVAGMKLGELKEALSHLARSPYEENFEEAIKNARLALKSEVDVPTGVLELVKYREQHKAHDPSFFWQLVGALGTYIQRHGILPVSEELPDMISSTEHFVTLKRIYAARFQQDVSRLASYLPKAVHIPMNWINVFCKNTRFLKYIYRNEDVEPNLQETEKLCGQYTNREIYAVASLIGGVAAQEATKIIMHQYMPMLGVLIYDAGKGELVSRDTEQYTIIDSEKP